MNFALNKREQTSYELNVKQSLKNFVDKIFSSSVKVSEKISGCGQLWRVWYLTNVKNFESLGLSLFESDLNNVLDLILNLFC